MRETGRSKTCCHLLPPRAQDYSKANEEKWIACPHGQALERRQEGSARLDRVAHSCDVHSMIAEAFIHAEKQPCWLLLL